MKAPEKDLILVVDDEETMRRSLADILRLEGYQVSAVSSGEAAVEALQRENYDLVLLDLKMPGMDGLEVLQIAKTLAPETKVILLTAHGSLESAIEALRLEAHDYLLKPATPRQIIDSVASALRRRADLQHKRMLLEQLDSSLKEVERHESQVANSPEETVLFPGVMLNIARRELWMLPENNPQGKAIKVALTPTEGKLLKVFMEYRGQVMSHRELVLKVQGYEVNDWEAPEVLRPLISRLRQKLSAFPGGETWIGNVRGTGYLLEKNEP